MIFQYTLLSGGLVLVANWVSLEGTWLFCTLDKDIQGVYCGGGIEVLISTLLSHPGHHTGISLSFGVASKYCHEPGQIHCFIV